MSKQPTTTPCNKSAEEFLECLARDKPPEIQECIRKAAAGSEDPQKLLEAVRELPANLEVTTLDLAHFALMFDPKHEMDGFGAMIDEAHCAMVTLGRIHEYARAQVGESGLDEQELSQFAWMRACVGIFATRCLRAAAIQRGAPKEVIDHMDAKLHEATQAAGEIGKAAAVKAIAHMISQGGGLDGPRKRRRGDGSPFDGSGGNYL